VTQLDLIPQFDGSTYEPARDCDRLTSQLERVKQLMADGKWRTLREIARHVGGSEAGVSARIRDMRKARFGGFTVEHRCIGHGVWEYRVLSHSAGVAQ